MKAVDLMWRYTHRTHVHYVLGRDRTPIIPNQSVLSDEPNVVDVATFTHCIASLFTTVKYDRI